MSELFGCFYINGGELIYVGFFRIRALYCLRYWGPCFWKLPFKVGTSRFGIPARERNLAHDVAAFQGLASSKYWAGYTNRVFTCWRGHAEEPRHVGCHVERSNNA